MALRLLGLGFWIEGLSQIKTLLRRTIWPLFCEQQNLPSF